MNKERLKETLIRHNTDFFSFGGAISQIVATKKIQYKISATKKIQY